MGDAGGSARGDGGEEAADGRGDREFGWRGWVLVAAMVVAFVVVPAVLYFLPRASGLAGSVGLSLRDAYLVLPLVPAVLVAVLAVWATTRP